MEHARQVMTATHLGMPACAGGMVRMPELHVHRCLVHHCVRSLDEKGRKLGGDPNWLASCPSATSNRE